jgi:hypothetical protein
LEVIDYQSIRKHIIKLGKEVEVKNRAKELQKQLRDPGADLPFRDAYEMAYNEIIQSRLY